MTQYRYGLLMGAFAILVGLAFAVQQGDKAVLSDERVDNVSSEFRTHPSLSVEGFSVEQFEGDFPPAGWSIVNPNAGSITFEHYDGANGPRFGGTKSTRIDFFSYSSTGHRDSLFTPVYAVATGDTFKFDWAYAQYTTAYIDSLAVLMSDDGGVTWSYVLFRRGGGTLMTAPPTTDPFVPTPSQWLTFNYGLSGFSTVRFVFVTYNAYGNNLYIDNVSVGTQVAHDVQPISIVNLPADTSYTIGGANRTLQPVVRLVNIGSSDIGTAFDVTLQASPSAYSSTKSVASLNAGQTVDVTFDSLTVNLGEPTNLMAYSSLGSDGNPSNDTLNQYSLLLTGAMRHMLLEEWTSSTCPPCATQNPTIDLFVDERWDSVVAIKYHVGWPAPGDDPMYQHNPTQSYDRRYYYGVNAAPTVIMDGVSYPEYPYSTYNNLLNPYTDRMDIATPMTMAVVNSRTVADSMHAIVTVNILSPMPEGSYYLRVHAIERQIDYTGTNGEPHHYDVFRRAYPNSSGTPVENVVGTQVFEFDYWINSVWADTMIFTSAFVQNDLTKEVMNCAKGEQTPHIVGIGSDGASVRRFALEQNYPNPFNPTTTIRYQVPSDGRVVLKVYNVFGQEVRTLVNGRQSAGARSVEWNGLDNRGRAVSSGVYFYRLEAADRSLTKKMLMIK